MSVQDIYIIPSQSIRLQGIDLEEIVEAASNNDEEELKDIFKRFGIEYK